jgi:hypothetical protein
MIFLQGFIKLDQGISEKCVGQTFDGRKKERPHLVERDKPKKFTIGWTNFAAVAMETKKGGFKKNLDSFHQTS